MKIDKFVHKIKEIGIKLITGIPDSTLQQLCNYLDNKGNIFEWHIVAENEGASIGIAIGEYLSTSCPACVYMQNSGLGNIVNPITSLANPDVYGIPMLLLIGWRGEPNVKDEPQHKYMGKLLRLLNISFSIIDSQTTENEINIFLQKAKTAFAQNKQYALVIKRDTFEDNDIIAYENSYSMKRERAIEIIAHWINHDDIVISTTGKISREMYEYSNAIHGNHNQTFLTVGGMGHANMIAYQIANRKPNQRILCLDGDGALLMHMGSMAVLGQNPADNMIHICLNNEAHESVGGMPTGASGISYAKIAQECGYHKVYEIINDENLIAVLKKIRRKHEMVFLEIKVSNTSRENLGRPTETAVENKKLFMEYIKATK